MAAAEAMVSSWRSQRLFGTGGSFGTLLVFVLRVRRAGGGGIYLSIIAIYP